MKFIKYIFFTEIGCLLATTCLVSILGFWVWWGMFRTYSAEIIDYSPTSFQEKAAHGFFYSIGNELKYANNGFIDPDEKTLWSKETRENLVSPDHKKILVVSAGKLYLISSDGSISKMIVRVKYWDSSDAVPGTEFYRQGHIQWSPDSTGFYIIKDRYSKEEGFPKHVNSKNSTLVHYNISDSSFEELIHPFHSFHYFTDLNDGGIFFSEGWRGDGKHLKKWTRAGTYDVDPKEIDRDLVFYSFGRLDYRYLYLWSHKGLYVKDIDSQQDLTGLFRYDSAPILVNKKGLGKNGKGTAFGVTANIFLPGDRYFLCEVGSKQFKGQLLIDVDEWIYKELPKDTRVYLSITTLKYKNFVIDTDGISADRNHLKNYSYKLRKHLN